VLPCRNPAGQMEPPPEGMVANRGGLLRLAGGITIIVFVALMMRAASAQQDAAKSKTRPDHRIAYVDGAHFATIQSALADSSCKGTIIVFPRHKEVEKEDIFAGFHEGTCMGSLYLLADVTITTDVQIRIPNAYVVRGDGGARIVAGKSFPVGSGGPFPAGGTVPRGSGRRINNVVTLHGREAIPYPVGTLLSLVGFSAINGACTVARIYGATVECSQTGPDVVSDGGGSYAAPVVVLGDVSPFDDGSRLENIGIDCDNVPGSIGVYSNTINENSGLLHYRIANCVSRGLKIEQSAGGSPQNFWLEDGYIGMSADSTAISKGVEIVGTTGTIIGNRGLDHLTVFTFSRTKLASCIDLDNTSGFYSRIHCEAASDGIHISHTVGATIIGVVGNQSVNNLIHITQARDTRNLMLSGITANASPVTIQDDFNRAHLTDREIALYALGSDGKPLTTSTNAVSYFDGGIATTKLNVGDGTPISRYARYAAVEHPIQIASRTCAAQTFNNVIGVVRGDVLIAVSKPTEQEGLSVSLGHVVDTNTLTVNFCNNSASPLRPTADETYQFVVVR